MSEVAPIPPDRRAATPYLCCRDAAQALDFYKNAFGAEETLRIADPSGRIMHAEFRIGDGGFMLSDEFPDYGALSPAHYGGSPVTLSLYVADVDTFVARAVAAGAVLQRPVEDQFYGDRGGKLQDPYGHLWWFASRRENLSAAELQARAQALFGGGA